MQYRIKQQQTRSNHFHFIINKMIHEHWLDYVLSQSLRPVRRITEPIFLFLIFVLFLAFVFCVIFASTVRTWFRPELLLDTILICFSFACRCGRSLSSSFQAFIMRLESVKVGGPRRIHWTPNIFKCDRDCASRWNFNVIVILFNILNLGLCLTCGCSIPHQRQSRSNEIQRKLDTHLRSKHINSSS